ncbi:hypothetical protein ACFXKC_50880 [Streptomyces sp. NPDC059340]|uniref:hypothetical protein n=1 Tax=Streptomyces sp. NPDC059340 TaxID=3346806 RepID=UPI0036BA22E2
MYREYRDVTGNRSAETEHIYGDLVLCAHRLALAVPLLPSETLPAKRNPGIDNAFSPVTSSTPLNSEAITV